MPQVRLVLFLLQEGAETETDEIGGCSRHKSLRVLLFKWTVLCWQGRRFLDFRSK